MCSGQGWTVVPGVLSPTEVQTCLDLTWDWLESLGSGIERSDPTTWTDHNWPGEFKSGITVQGQLNKYLAASSLSLKAMTSSEYLLKSSLVWRQSAALTVAYQGSPRGPAGLRHHLGSPPLRPHHLHGRHVDLETQGLRLPQ